MLLLWLSLTLCSKLVPSFLLCKEFWLYHRSVVFSPGVCSSWGGGWNTGVGVGWGGGLYAHFKPQDSGGRHIVHQFIIFPLCPCVCHGGTCSPQKLETPTPTVKWCRAGGRGGRTNREGSLPCARAHGWEQFSQEEKLDT